MRTLATRTNALTCWMAIGMLSACTVTVNEAPPETTEDSGVRTTDEPEKTDGGQPGEDAGGETTADDDTSEEPDTIDVDLNPDGGASAPEADGGGTVEADAGPVSERFGCGSRDVEGATVIEEAEITEETTWSGTVYITQPTYLMEGGELTIEPGTKIIMAVDSFLEFGWNSQAVSVFAEGTAAAPITICGEEAEAGYWRSVIFGPNVTSNSTFKNVLVSDGGANDAAVVFNADVHVDNLQVVDSGDVGVEATDFADDSAKLSVYGSADAAVRLTGSGGLTNFPLGGTFEGNDQQVVIIDFAEVLGDESVIIHDAGISYLQAQTLYIEQSAALTVEAGVNYQFSADSFLEVGWNGGDSTLFIQGTEGDPVVFEGQGDEPGYWSGLIVGDNVRTNSTVSYLTIRNAGGDDDPALLVRAAITLDHVTLEDNETGAQIGEQGLDPDSANLTITGTESVPLTVEGPNALVSLPQGGSYTGNSDDVIAIDGADYEVTGTIADLGVPYRVLNPLYTYDGSSLTIEPGVSFQMSADTFITFGWNSSAATVHAVGTEEDPIVFIGTDASAGSWRGLNIGVNVTTDSEFAYLSVEHAGDPSNTATSAAIYLDAAVPVTNSWFNEIAGYGVKLDDEADSALVTGNSAGGVTLGVVLDLTVEN
jgi:hypothetical protein